MSKHDFEFYETPETFGQYLFRAVDITGLCCEPCVGSGAIVRAAERWRGMGGPRSWITNELDKRWSADFYMDAAAPAFWHRIGEVDWTVSNPPFSCAVPIVDRALLASRVGVAMYLRISIHEVLKGGTRRTFFADNPPTAIHFLPRFAHQRSKKTGEWSTDSVTACWTVWDKRATNQRIVYAPEWVLEALDKETPEYRARMDALMATREQVA